MHIAYGINYAINIPKEKDTEQWAQSLGSTVGGRGGVGY